MLIDDSDPDYTIHSRASGLPGVVLVPRDGRGPSVIMRARGGQKLSVAVPPRAPRAAGGSIAESVMHREDASDYAPIPKSIWGDVPVAKPWSPPPLQALAADDYAPMVEHEWSEPTTARPRTAAADLDADFAPFKPSPWGDR